MITEATIISKTRNLGKIQFKVGFNKVAKIDVHYPSSGRSPDLIIRYEDQSAEFYCGVKFMTVEKRP